MSSYTWCINKILHFTRCIHAWERPCSISSLPCRSGVQQGQAGEALTWWVKYILNLELPKYNRAFQVFRSNFWNGHKMGIALWEHRWKCPYFSELGCVCVTGALWVSFHGFVYRPVSMWSAIFLLSLFLSSSFAPSLPLLPLPTLLFHLVFQRWT